MPLIYAFSVHFTHEWKSEKKKTQWDVSVSIHPRSKITLSIIEQGNYRALHNSSWSKSPEEGVGGSKNSQDPAKSQDVAAMRGKKRGKAEMGNRAPQATPQDWGEGGEDENRALGKLVDGATEEREEGKGGPALSSYFSSWCLHGGSKKNETARLWAEVSGG